MFKLFQKKRQQQIENKSHETMAKFCPRSCKIKDFMSDANLVEKSSDMKFFKEWYFVTKIVLTYCEKKLF